MPIFKQRREQIYVNAMSEFHKYVEDYQIQEVLVPVEPISPQGKVESCEYTLMKHLHHGWQ